MEHFKCNFVKVENEKKKVVKQSSFAQAISNVSTMTEARTRKFPNRLVVSSRSILQKGQGCRLGRVRHNCNRLCTKRDIR